MKKEKCFTIKINNDYINDVTRPIPNFSIWNMLGLKIDVTNDIDSAKHYRTKSYANHWLKKGINKIKEHIICTTAHIQKDKLLSKEYEAKDGSTNNWIVRRITNYENGKLILEGILKQLESAEVLQYETENPNFAEKNPIRYDENFLKYCGGSKGININKVSHTRYTCKSCGIKMKNIPYIEVHTGNTIKVCCFCYMKVFSEVENSISNMDKKYKQDIENDKFLRNL